MRFRGTMAAVVAVTATLGGPNLASSWAASHRHKPKPSKREQAIPDPFTTGAMNAFLASRQGNVTAAAEDLLTGRTFVYHPFTREQTASIIKVNILETLLRQVQERNSWLSSSQLVLAQGMIENSNNDDATALFNQEGGAGALAAFDARLAMDQTTPNVAWGLTTTTAGNQIKLLQQLVLQHSLLDQRARQYQLGLMSHVESDQHWGVSGGVPPGVLIALKNGWLPVPGGWQVNSIGRIRGDGRWYLIAVMTNGNSTEGYGIDTIQGISSLVWRDFAPRRAAHHHHHS